MEYWVYENWTHEFAKVHEADCPFCNSGRGTHAGSTNRNGKWHGLLATRDAAFAFAKRTGRETVQGCRFCSP